MEGFNSMDDYNPYDEGRWYRFFLESENSIKLVESDIAEAVMFGSSIKLPYGYTVLDVISDFNIVTDSNFSSAVNDVSIVQGCQCVGVVPRQYFDFGYVYVFAKKWN